MGLEKLNERFANCNLREYFSGMFCRDNPKNTRFCINFFTSIGLGALTAELREFLQNAERMVEEALKLRQLEDEENSDSSDSDSEEDSDSGSSSGSGSDSGSNSDSDSNSKDNSLNSKIKNNKGKKSSSPSSRNESSN
jgi:pre-mRNA-splicing factor CWC22